MAAKSVYPTDVLALTALSLIQEVIARLPAGQVPEVFEAAAKLHHEPVAGENSLNQQVAHLIREIERDLLKRR